MADTGLKRHYTGDCARKIADMLNHTDRLIDPEEYAAAVDARITGLELKDRVLVLAEELKNRLPDDYLTSLTLITDSLGPELREEQGMFTESWWLMPVARFVEEYGLEHPDASLSAIELITRRHTGEFAIRPFVLRYPDLTMKYVSEWAVSESHNVRRLASEGIRPRLPWHSRLDPFIEDPTPVIRILDLMVEDPSKYVRMSVANNLNDIAKDHPDLAVATANRWLRETGEDNGTGNSSGHVGGGSGGHVGGGNGGGERGSNRARWVVNHGLRTLIKSGHPGALETVGAAPDPSISITDVQIDAVPQADARPGTGAQTGTNPNANMGPDSHAEAITVHIGDSLRITATVTNYGDEARDVVVDYRIHFRRADGSLRPTTFKLGRIHVEPGSSATVSKRHSFTLIKTRMYYPGEQGLSVQANGAETEMTRFTLESISA